MDFEGRGKSSSYDLRNASTSAQLRPQTPEERSAAATSVANDLKRCADSVRDDRRHRRDVDAPIVRTSRFQQAAIVDGASVDGRVSAGGRRAPISSVVIPGTEPRNRRAWPRIESAKEQGMRDRDGRDRGDGYGTEGGREWP